CNICFVLAILIQWMPSPLKGDIIATTVILGYLFAAVVNLVINIWCAILVLSGNAKNAVPVWLMVTNFLFLIPELILLLK
ncbi:MAG TPA: hypothetical protein VNV85_02880, partial [Puia sp.]|nr:hypothetical protein [Puia sp.]